MPFILLLAYTALPVCALAAVLLAASRVYVPLAMRHQLPASILPSTCTPHNSSDSLTPMPTTAYVLLAAALCIGSTVTALTLFCLAQPLVHLNAPSIFLALVGNMLAKVGSVVSLCRGRAGLGWALSTVVGGGQVVASIGAGVSVVLAQKLSGLGVVGLRASWVANTAMDIMFWTCVLVALHKLKILRTGQSVLPIVAIIITTTVGSIRLVAPLDWQVCIVLCSLHLSLSITTLCLMPLDITATTMSPGQTRLIESCSSSIVNLTPRASENDPVVYNNVLKLRWDVVAELVTVVSVSVHDSDSHELEGILKTVELTVIEESKGKR